MGKSVYRKISIELDDKLKALHEELLRSGIPISKIGVGRIVAGKISDINIKVNIFKKKRRDKRVQFE